MRNDISNLGHTFAKKPTPKRMSDLTLYLQKTNPKFYSGYSLEFLPGKNKKMYTMVEFKFSAILSTS